MITKGQGRAGGLAAVLGSVARDLQQERSPEETLDAITHAAVETVTGAERAAVTLVVGRSRQVRTVAATDTVAELIDRAQYETGEGPCLSALWHEPVVRMSDMDVEGRWPRWTARARANGVGSMLCFRLFVAEDRLGALNLCAGEPDAFTDDDEDVGRLFATHAAVALASARKVNQLERAVASRDIIGQAKGILMERHKINADDAFLLLVRASQKAQYPLREVAEYVADTGESLPP